MSVRDRDCVYEAGACGGNVESGDRIDTEAILNLARERGERILGRDGADDDRVEIARLESGALERDAAGVNGDVGERLALAERIALADPGARLDPFVGGVHVPLEILVGQSGTRQSPSGRNNSGAHC